MYGDIPFVFGNLLWACSVSVLREVLKCDEWRKTDREDLLGTWGMGFEYPKRTNKPNTALLRLGLKSPNTLFGLI